MHVIIDDNGTGCEVLRGAPRRQRMEEKRLYSVRLNVKPCAQAQVYR